MRHLNPFLRFDLPAFLSGKELTAIGSRPWVDPATGVVLGTKVDAAITKDNTEYPAPKDGMLPLTNIYEKLTIKIPKDITIPAGAVIAIVDGVGTVYGDYRNQLSIKAADVKVITSPTPPAKGNEKAAA